MMGEGIKVRFVPSSLESEKLTAEDRRRLAVTATVVYVNWEHKYFTCAWTANDAKRRESFKFSEIGKKVKVCGK
jgi:hypothetical protein